MDVSGNLFDPLAAVVPPVYFGAKFRIRHHLYQFNDGYVVAMMTSTEDWETNGEVYAAMTRFANTFQYYRHPEMPNTLFLTADRQEDQFAEYTHVELPYPDGWVEHVDENGLVTLAPEDGAGGVRVTLTPVPMGEWYLNEADLDQVEAEYNLPADTVWEQLEGSSCNGPKAVYFEKDGRAGYVRHANLYIIEVSANDFETHETLLSDIMNNVFSEVSCG